MTSTPQQLAKYRIVDTIGKGAFATVYRAHDVDIDRDVALKVLDPKLTRDPAWVHSFRFEARTVARLRHPRIVTIHDVGQSEGTLFIAMDLIEGGNLADQLARTGAQPWAEVVRLVGEIAEALDFAHSQGVLHRDIKPANVLLDARAGCILTDFGLARLLANNPLSISLSLAGGLVGTPSYIAPEIWNNQAPVTQTDIYALGCIAFELVTGKPLFGGASLLQVLKAIDQGPQLPPAWPDGTPPGFSAALAPALATDPASRYTRAGELAAALRALNVDRLAEPYAAMEAALVGKAWAEALELAAAIRSSDDDYRDVMALEQKALAGMKEEARREQAALWQAEATTALAASDLDGAALAVRQCLQLEPNNVAGLALLAQVEAARQQLFQTSGVSTVQMDDAESIRTDLEDATLVHELSAPLVNSSSLEDNPWASTQMAEPLSADPNALAEGRVETTEPARSGQIAPGAKRNLFMILILSATILVVVVALGMVFSSLKPAEPQIVEVTRVIQVTRIVTATPDAPAEAQTP